MMSRYIVHKFLIDMPKDYRIIGQTYMIEHCYRGKNVLLRSQANMEKCEIKSLENEAVIIDQIVKVITRYDAEWETINLSVKILRYSKVKMTIDYIVKLKQHCFNLSEISTQNECLLIISSDAIDFKV